jgi:pimeloyl-ACP methyl ester carboxylesterase
VTASDGCRPRTASDGSGPRIVFVHGGPGLWDTFGGLVETLSPAFTTTAGTSVGVAVPPGRDRTACSAAWTTSTRCADTSATSVST